MVSGKKIIWVGMASVLVLGVAWGLQAVSVQKKNEVSRSGLRSLALAINADFFKIRQEVERVALYTAGLYDAKVKVDVLTKVDATKYRLADNGVFYKPQNDGNSAVFVSGVVPVDDGVKAVVYFTEPLDEKFKQIVGKYPEAVQVYYNDRNSVNRIYPFFDVLTQYEPKMNIPAFNFYYLADEAHDPAKKGVWVNEPYVDPAGRGWMVSAIAPVYVNGVLEGVPGIDVTITTITDRYLAKDSADVMIIDASGTVVATQEDMANLFELPPLIEHKYLETIKSDTYHVEYYNLLKNRSRRVREMAEKILKARQREVLFRFGKENILIMAEPIVELDWVILKAVRR